jgi:serine/threonine protein kinase
MHADGVLHRDVKPSNIGFTGRGDPKLLDLGIAVVMGLGGEGSDERVMGSGTPAYMAPEAIDGLPPTPAFDVWGLTVSLYEAIAGRNPYAAATRLRTVAKVALGEPADLRTDVMGPPEAVVAFFREALTRESPNRPRSAGELILRLEALIGLGWSR